MTDDELLDWLRANPGSKADGISMGRRLGRLARQGKVVSAWVRSTVDAKGRENHWFLKEHEAERSAFLARAAVTRTSERRKPPPELDRSIEERHLRVAPASEPLPFTVNAPNSIWQSSSKGH